jgi:cobalt-zinc-cadmium efflux system outer membrane protein
VVLIGIIYSGAPSLVRASDVVPALKPANHRAIPPAPSTPVLPVAPADSTSSNPSAFAASPDATTLSPSPDTTDLPPLPLSSDAPTAPDSITTGKLSAVTNQAAPLPHRRFSLTTCFDTADAHNKEILVAAANLPVMQANIVIAKAIPNPTYSMTYGFGNAWRIILAGNNQQVGWTEEVQVAGRRTKKEAVATANYLQQAFQVEAVRFDVHNRIRRAYAELVAATAYARLIDTQQEIAQRLLSISSKRYRAGKAAGSEVFQAKLLVVQYDTQRNQAQGRVIQDCAALAQLLGDIPRGQEIIDTDENELFGLSASANALVPDPERGVPPLQTLLPLAWQQRNDLKTAIQQAWSDRKALSLAKTQRIPDPFIGFSYMFSTYQGTQPRFFDPAFGKVPFQPGYLLTVQEEMPIFYHYQGQVAQAQATWQQQIKQVDVQRSQIAADIVSAYVALQLTRKNIDQFQRDLLPDAETVALLARRSYEMGKTDLATAVLAQQQYQQLRSQYFDSVVAYQTAWADLEKAIGVPLKS